MTGEDLILGIVEDYHWHQIARFFLTLRRTGFRGHLCIFAGPGISSGTVRRMRDHGAEVIRYGPVFPFVDQPHADAPGWLPRPIYIFNYRHFLYLDYLLKNAGRFRNVLLTDVKDVVFQKDPFEFQGDGRLCVAMESPKVPIGKCSYTSEWIVAGYGRDVLDQLRDEELSCAGTTFGSADAVLAYLRSMIGQVQAMRDAYHCADQAAHNLMLHSGALEPVTRMYNFRAPVATVGTEQEFRINARGELVNHDGSTVAIVHQYDRHPQLVRLFDRMAYPSPAHRAAAMAERFAARARSAARRRAGAVLRKLRVLRSREAHA